MKKILIILIPLFFLIGLGMAFVPEDQFIEVGSILAVVTLAVPAFWAMWNIYGGRGIFVVILLGLFALMIETIGIHTGFPYSHFEYMMPFGYKLFETTPWTVFIAWSPLVIGVFLLTHSWFKKWWSRVLVYLGLLIGTDLVLDPGAVARGLWQYEEIGLWYAVPIENFFGWVFSGLIAYGLLEFGLTERKVSQRNLILGSLSLVLSLTLWTGVTGGYSIWLPAIIGIILLAVVMFGLLKKPSHR
ncbi:MAG: putative membrane protein [Candidatus Paceibacteria bacterium]|jgi:putative membrane protein